MGIGIFAVGDDDTLLEKTFSDAGLDSNFRYCEVDNWENIVCDCLGLDEFTKICWMQHGPDVVKSWLELAKKHVIHTESASYRLGVEKFVKFMEICVELNVSLHVF